MIPITSGAVYAATKAAVIHLCRSLVDVGYGIRVNAICPSYTATPLTTGMGEAAVESMKATIGKLLQPDDIAKGNFSS